jgi:nucleotide-binding universal stress UspA family protein
MSTGSPFIVVAYDGSSDADLALLWGIRTAELTHQNLRVVVVALATSQQPLQIRDYEEHRAHSAAASARDAVKVAEGIEAEVLLERGWTVPTLLRAAEGAGLVVAGSRGHNSFEAHWLGSVSQHLAGHAACPVAVVRRTHNQHAKKILVGVDGSPASEHALRYAAERATLTGESVVAVHAYQFPTFSGTGLAVLPIDIDTELVDASERLAAELVAGIAEDYPDVRLRSTAVVGRAGRVLARLSDDASLVVVGSRGRTPWKEMLLGSVSQEVLSRAECPVVVVR